MDIWNTIENVFCLKRPKKLSDKDRKCYAKDRVRHNGKVISLAKYNKVMDMHYTLQDVYGEAYVQTLTEEDKAQFDPYENMIVVPSVLETDKQFFECKLFAESWLKNDYSRFMDYLDEDVTIVIQGKKTIKGKKAFVDYWTDLYFREKELEILNKLSVVHSNYLGTAALFMYRKSYWPMYLFFSVKKGKIVNAVYCTLLPVPYPYEISKASCGYEWLPLDLEKITLGMPVQPEANYMPCMRCGKTSDQLQWNELEINSGWNLYKGVVTICPDCHKVVDFRYGKPEKSSSPKEDFSVVNLKPKALSLTIPPLLGIRSFYYDQPLKHFEYVKKPDHSDSFHAIVSDFDFLAIMHLYEEDRMQYNLLKQIYVQAFENGVYEAGNNLFVLLHNFESKLEEAVDYLEISIEHESTNAMINYFTVLWGDEKYQEAADFLKRVFSNRNPSVYCLWNLAMLYYKGEAIEHNPLLKDETFAFKILSRIDHISPSTYQSKTEIDNIAENARRLTIKDKCEKSCSPLAESGWAFQQMVYRFMSPAMQVSEDDRLIKESLEDTCFRLSPGQNLGLQLAEKSGIGDNSYFYIYEKDKDHKNRNVFDHLLVEKSEVGAWQAYLMYTSSRIMPAYWHGLYVRSKSIFVEDDLRDIPLLRNRDFTFFEEDGLLYPTVSFIDNDTAQVECTYWNDWKGLVRETVRISFSGEKVINVTTIKTKTLLDYHCGIYY